MSHRRLLTEVGDPQRPAESSPPVRPSIRSPALCHVAGRVLDVGSEGIYLKPTAVGLLSTFSFRLQNETRVPLSYHLVLPDRLREVFSVAPAVGRLKGKEIERIQVLLTNSA